MNKSIALLQGYYKYLALGQFFDTASKRNDLSSYAQDIKVKTGEETHFTFKKSMIQDMLIQIYANPTKDNVFGFLNEISALRGMFATMRELLDNDEDFDKHCKNILKNQYFPFEQMIRLLRNCLSHALDPHISLKKDDYFNRKGYLLSQDVSILHLRYHYSEHIDQWKGGDTYGPNVRLLIKSVRSGKKLHDYIPEHQVYLIAELCYNISLLYKQTK